VNSILPERGKQAIGGQIGGHLSDSNECTGHTELGTNLVTLLEWGTKLSSGPIPVGEKNLDYSLDDGRHQAAYPHRICVGTS
jgi:hypothetical protein